MKKVWDKTTYMDPLSITHTRVKSINYYKVYRKGEVIMKWSVSHKKTIELYLLDKNIECQAALL